ncbi:DUF4214 domain-containing protein [Isosphaeraceae bacterium EP7]
MPFTDRRAKRRRRIRLTIEGLEPRWTPAGTPALVQRIELPGAGTAWNYNIGTFVASPLIADLDQSGRNSVVVPGGNYNLYSYQSGSGQPTKTFSTGGIGGEFQTTPIIVDLGNGTRALFAGDTKGQLWGWDAKTAALLPGWPQNTLHRFSDQANEPDQILGGIATGDLDGDGSPEIVVTSINHLVSAFHADGSLFWQFSNDDTVFSAPVIGDIDGDGKLDIVIGGDSSKIPSGPPNNVDVYSAGGRLTVLSWNGRREWVAQTDQAIQSSPSLIDLNSDGNLEVVVGSGSFYQGDRGNGVYAFNANGTPFRNGNSLFYRTVPVGSTVNGKVRTSPVAADLDGDGSPEVVVTDFNGRVHAIKANGQALWAVDFLPGQYVVSTAAIADVNGDGTPDVIVAHSDYTKAFDGKTGRVVWTEITDSPDPSVPDRFFSGAAIGDLKGDGTFQMVSLATALAPNRSSVLSPSYLRVYDLPASTSINTWAEPRGDASGAAIARSEGWLTNYVGQLYSQAVGRAPTGTDLAAQLAGFRRAASLLPGTLGIVGSAEARAKLVTTYYLSYLGRTPDQAGLQANLAAFDRGATPQTLLNAFLVSPEFYGIGGNTSDSGWINNLYRATLARVASQPEINAWLGVLQSNPNARGNLPLSFIGSREWTEGTVRDVYYRYFGGSPAPDTLASAGRDLRAGVSTEVVTARLLASAGNYANTTQDGSTIRFLYRDVLQREPSGQEVANWLNQVEAGLSVATLTRAFVTSSEYRDIVVASYYQTYLGRGSTQAERASLVALIGQPGRTRNDALAALMASDEYYRNAGNTPNAYVNKVFNDLLGHGPDANQLSTYTTKITISQTRSQLPSDLIYNAAGEYSTKISNGLVYRYLRRFPYTKLDGTVNPPDASAQAAATKPFADFLTNRGNPEELEIGLLTSGEYLNLARGKAAWNGVRWGLGNRVYFA